MANCKIPLCVALASTRGFCAIHAKAEEGPHANKCVKCRRAINRGEFWVRVDGSEIDVVHPSCLRALPKVAKPKKNWEKGLGSLP